MFPLVDFIIESVIPPAITSEPQTKPQSEQVTPGIVVKSSSAATVVHLV
jgi:hypothetical protein